MHDAPAPRFGYPVVLDLHDVAVLVVGAGRIGARKAAGLAAAGAAVRVVGIRIGSEVERLRRDGAVTEVIVGPFAPSHLDGVRLVVTATGDARTDHLIAEAARRAGIWTNAADQPADCEFILPAIARSGRVSVAVSTDGASPALARRLRDRIAESLDGRVARAADVLAVERATLRAAGRSTEDVSWEARLDELLAD